MIAIVLISMCLVVKAGLMFSHFVPLPCCCKGGDMHTSRYGGRLLGGGRKGNASVADVLGNTKPNSLGMSFKPSKPKGHFDASKLREGTAISFMYKAGVSDKMRVMLFERIESKSRVFATANGCIQS